jgi:uncharacterized hydrophobic protein (TIGR00271 family)
MRQLQLQVRRERVKRVMQIAREHESLAPSALQAERVERDGRLEEGWVLIFLNLPNHRVGRFVDAVREEVEDAQFVLLPLGSLPLQTPLEEVQERVHDVSRLSTLELVLSSMQSVGSWKGMVLYSALAGIIGAYGVIFDVGYLLVAAMLINPMGAPAMVSVIGVAIGDPRMFGRGAVRFLVSLVLQAVAAAMLGYGYALTVSTEMMEQITSLSVWGVAVALAAGAAGAITQVHSERDSLVSGTAAGFMIAAALAPPAAVLGLSLPLQRWDYAGLMGFLLLLQFPAIALGGWLALLAHGVQPADPSIGRGRAVWRTALAAAVLIATVGMVWWQAGQEPRFLKADLSRQALEIARDALERVEGAHLIEASARFTRPELERYDREGMLMEITVENAGGASDQELESAVRAEVRRLVHARMRDVVPFVDVTVLEGESDSP